MLTPPWKYRPADPDYIDWEDNAISNSLAWISERFTPGFCGTPDHWTSIITGHLWTSCYCCAVIRYALVGFAAGLTVGLII